MSTSSDPVSPREPSRGRFPRSRRRALVVAAFAAAALLAIVVAVGWADDMTFGSSLAGSPTVTKTATADSVYWAKIVSGGGSPSAQADGQVKSVTVKGNAVSSAHQTIFFQVLRPQPDGSFLVVATSQPFTLPTAPGTHTFTPTGMSVMKGDFIGLATIGGDFQIAASVSGSSTNDFTGHNQDMNGDSIKPTVVEANVELLVQVDLVPTPPPGSTSSTGTPPPPPPPPPPPKKKPCHCASVTVTIDPTLINKKKLRPDKHDFGVGFSWTLTCTAGDGGCTALIHFLPPEIKAGTLPKPKNGLHLALNRMGFSCNADCGKGRSGRFQIPMRSRHQLNQLFGRTLAFTLRTTCNGVTTDTPVNVFVDSHGVLRRPLRLKVKH